MCLSISVIELGSSEGMVESYSNNWRNLVLGVCRTQGHPTCRSPTAGCQLTTRHYQFLRWKFEDAMTEAFIFDAVRTPRGKGKKDGALYSVKPVDLIAGLLKALQARNNLDTSQVDDIVLGCVTPVGDQGADIAKTAAMVADWDVSVSGMQLNRFCASGLEAVNLGAMKVRSGFEDLVVVGGVESMSRVPMGSDGGAWVMDPATNMHSHFTPQGIGADLIATLEGFSRADVDAYALRSQQKAARARADGSFDKSLIPVTDQNGIVLLDHDEFIRGDSTLEGLGNLKPSFEMMGQMGFDSTALRVYSHVEQINHVHTPGNSSGIVDGSALMLIGSAVKGKELGLQPRARIVATAVIGTDPTIMLTGPAPATRKALAKAGLTVSDIDLFEVNEAFASVVMKFMKDMGVSEDKVNVNGGSIAMGHPLGATGCAILGTLLDELEKRELRYGLATLCVGGGMGIATIIERI
jgi:acetyl-CoA C-acetyltransferase